MSCFIFFQQKQRLKTSINTAAFINCETFLLSYCQQPSVTTEYCTSHGAFEVELTYHKTALKIEDCSVSCVVDGYESDAVWREDDQCICVRVLEGKESSFVMNKVNCFDRVSCGGIDNISMEETIAGGVG